MKESNTKTSGRSSKVAETKPGTKNNLSSQSNSHSSSTSRGSACSSDKSTSQRRSNNPEGINQYTKKSNGK